MKKTGVILGIFAIFFAYSGLGQVSAAPTAEQWAAVMNVSGRQRMLSQKMSKEALMIAANINPEENRKNLKDTIALFEKSLEGLISGDPAMNLPACEQENILEQLERVKLLYQEMNQSLAKTVEGGVAEYDDMKQIAKASLPLLNAADKAVQMFNQEAQKVLVKDPTLATVINISGRQRMLSQKIAKEALLLYMKVDIDVQSQALSQTLGLFDKSLKALEFGDSEMGVPPTKDEGIIAQLKVVEAPWLILKPVVDKIATSVKLYAVSKDDINTVCALAATLLTESNKAVSMYEKVAK